MGGVMSTLAAPALRSSAAAVGVNSDQNRMRMNKRIRMFHLNQNGAFSVAARATDSMAMAEMAAP